MFLSILELESMQKIHHGEMRVLHVLPALVIANDEYDDYGACINEAENRALECELQCHSDNFVDVECSRDCLRTLAEEEKNCPGNENCPNGCPCPDYRCPSTSVLVLCTFDNNRPLMIDNTGAIDYSFAWDWGDATTEVRDSCSVQYEGEIWIFGGFNNLRQIARVNGCGIEQRQEQLDFDFHSGGCGISSGSIFLCFDIFDARQCHQGQIGPLGQFEPVTEQSTYQHKYTRIGASDTKLLALGSLTPGEGHYHGELLE